MMIEILTVTSDKNETSIAPDLYCIKSEYTEAQVAEFDTVAFKWELYVENDITFMEWQDSSKYVLELDRDMYVIQNGTLIGFCFDSCFFELSRPESYSMCNHNPDPRRIGRNFIGSVTYTLHSRTGCERVKAIKV